MTLAATLVGRAFGIPARFHRRCMLGIDRFMSECRSLTNFIGNAVACVIVTIWEGRLDRAEFDAALDGKMPSVDQLDPKMIAD